MRKHILQTPLLEQLSQEGCLDPKVMGWVYYPSPDTGVDERWLLIEATVGGVRARAFEWVHNFNNKVQTIKWYPLGDPRLPAPLDLIVQMAARNLVFPTQIGFGRTLNGVN